MLGGNLMEYGKVGMSGYSVVSIQHRGGIMNELLKSKQSEKLKFEN